MGATPIGPNVTLVGIVYSKASGQVRRHIYAEVDHSEYDREPLLAGEAMCFVDMKHHYAGHDVFHTEIRNAVKAHGGVDAILFHHEEGAKAHRWVAVDENNIVHNHTMCCASIDNVKHETVTLYGGGVVPIAEGNRALTLDEMGWINVPADHGPVAPGYIYDPAGKTFSPGYSVVHPSKQK